MPNADLMFKTAVALCSSRGKPSCVDPIGSTVDLMTEAVAGPPLVGDAHRFEESTASSMQADLSP